MAMGCMIFAIGQFIGDNKKKLLIKSLETGEISIGIYHYKYLFINAIFSSKSCFVSGVPVLMAANA